MLCMVGSNERKQTHFAFPVISPVTPFLSYSYMLYISRV